MAPKNKEKREEKRNERVLKAYVRDELHHLGGKLPKNAAYLEVHEHRMKLRQIRPSGHRKSMARRGVIKSYSARSRSRLIDRLNCLHWPDTPVYFCDLTYPDDFQDDPEQVSRDLNAFWQAVEHRWPSAALAWKKESKVRKFGDHAGEIAPHYHFFAFNIPVDQYEFWNFVRCKWENLIFDRERGSRADPADFCAALEHGTDVKLVQNRKQAIYYVSKYMAKEDEPGTQDWGRRWGFLGKKNLNFQPLTNVIAFTHIQLIAFKLLVEQFLADKKSKFLDKYREYAEWMGFTIYTDAVEFASYFVQHWIEPAPVAPFREFPAGPPRVVRDFDKFWERPPGWKPAELPDREPEPYTLRSHIKHIQEAVLSLEERLSNLRWYTA